MANFAFFKNHQLSAPDKEKMDKLKEVFPKATTAGVYIRATKKHWHSVKKGSSSSRLKDASVPCSPIAMVMEATSTNPQTYEVDTITVSSIAPNKNPLTGRAKYGKNAYFLIAHNARVFDMNVLYFLYYHAGRNIGNGFEPNPNAPFEFVMPEKESKELFENETRISEFSVKASKLEIGSVKELLIKFKRGTSEIDERNRLDLTSLFKSSTTEVQENLNMFVDAILSDGKDEKKESTGSVQVAVENALAEGRMKIEDGKLFLLKLGTTEFAATPTMKFKSTEQDTQLLEAIEFFNNNQDKLKYIK